MDRYILLWHNQYLSSFGVVDDKIYTNREAAMIEAEKQVKKDRGDGISCLVLKIIAEENARRAAVDDPEGNYDYLVCKVEAIVNSDVVAVESSFDDGDGSK